MRHHLILDLETLGTSDNGVILSVGALLYFPKDESGHPKTQTSFTKTWKLNAKEQIQKYNRSVNKDTLDWWKSQGEAAKKVLNPSPNDLTVQEFFSEFYSWLAEYGYEPSMKSTWLEGTILQRGTIDHAMIANLAYDLEGTSENFYKVLSWKKVRDIRTIIDMINTGLYDDANVYSVPCDESVRNYTDGQFSSWWKYLDDFKERENLVSHDAVSDCIIQLQSLKVLEFC